MKILVFVGTKPEAIKLIPLINELKKKIEVDIISSGQHSSAVKKTLDLFGLYPNYDFNISSESLSLSETVSKIMDFSSNVLLKNKYDYTIVQGDTSTAIAGSLVSYYCNIKVVHIEAGLRTNNRFSPFPEEMNRRLITQIADYHFAPDNVSKKNLIVNRIENKKIFVVGNIGIDLLVEAFISKFVQANNIFSMCDFSKKVLLVTIHRRENIGVPLIKICNAIRQIVDESDEDLQVLFPLHPNKDIISIVNNRLNRTKKVFLLNSLNYFSFLYVLQYADVVLTDSGGVQEEAIFLEKPLLILREKTERFFDSKNVELVGSSVRKIVETTKMFLKLKVAKGTIKVEKKMKGYKMIAPNIADIFIKFLK